MIATMFDPTRCELGEGPLWHPGRGQLFWFDILAGRLLTREGDDTRHWQFGGHVSAAGWVDDNTLLIASESHLLRFEIATGKREDLVPLEADNPATRSNDGRADPWGGFWIGTMGKSAEPGAGAIYRYWRGEVRRLHDGITVPNAIAFAPDRSVAYFTDTPTRRIERQPLDPGTGWPSGPAESWLDLAPAGLVADGAVTDAAGNLWVAHWGAGRVAAYSADAKPLLSVDIPGRLSTCPAFGGPDFTTLYCTTAMEGIDAETRAAEPAHGQTFAATGVGQGRAEPAVLL